MCFECIAIRLLQEVVVLKNAVWGFPGGLWPRILTFYVCGIFLVVVNLVGVDQVPLLEVSSKRAGSLLYLLPYPYNMPGVE